jgi:hypothetical protein
MEEFEVIQVAVRPEPDVRPDVVSDPDDRHTEGVDSPEVEAPGKSEDAPPAQEEPFLPVEEKKGKKA